ncbi:MAG: peptidoglycan-binding protein [Myxococcaceae bacterium]
MAVQAIRNASSIGFSSSLERGDRSVDVKRLQEELVRLGYMTQAQMNTGPGIFGPRTYAAVVALQRDKGLGVDGIVGQKTRAAIGNAQASSGAFQRDQWIEANGASTSNVTPAPDAPQGKRYSAKGTGYYPDSSLMEGGYVDRKGHKLYTLQAYLAGKAPYVSVAMDSKAFPYGTKLRIAELEAKYGRQIEFRVVDTGGAFKGRGTSRIDICTANEKASLDPTINGKLTLVF